MNEASEAGRSLFKQELLAALPSLRAFAKSLVGDTATADDLVQETVLKAWGKQASYQVGTNIKAWLFTILRNDFYSRMRKVGREVPDPDGVYSGKLSVQPAQHAALDLQDMQAALARLPDDQREAVILVGASGMSYEEAADICDCAVGTVKSRVSRARATLQELLKISSDSNH